MTSVKKIKLDAAQKKAVAQLSDVRAYRKISAPNQSVFWSHFGVTQSGGSRYESGRGIPNATRILMALYAMGAVSNDDMARAQAVAAKVAETYRTEASEE